MQAFTHTGTHTCLSAHPNPLHGPSALLTQLRAELLLSPLSCGEAEEKVGSRLEERGWRVRGWFTDGAPWGGMGLSREGWA